MAGKIKFAPLSEEKLSRSISPQDYAALDESMFDASAAAQDSAETIVRDSSTYWQDVWKRFRRDKLAIFGVCVILVMTIACIIVPMFSPYSYSTMDLTNMNAGPSLSHPCGTDQMGRDLFIRILYGARISLSIGLVAAAINFVIGVVYGGIAGYVGGKVDMVMMRIVDILIALPSMLYIVLIMLVLGSSVGSVIIALCFTSWTGTARVVRSEVMKLKHAEYVLAARLSGARFWNLLVTHLIPNAMGPIIVSTAFLIPSAIFSEAFLSFLGIGIQAPMASWGTLANDARSTLLTFPHQMIFPVLAICITMFSFNFIGDGLRDALDPKLKK